jgi:hypothetical protein
MKEAIFSRGILGNTRGARLPRKDNAILEKK